MRFLLELAAGFVALAMVTAVALMAVGVFLMWKTLLGDLRRRRQDRYDDRLVEQAWDNPRLLWQHPIPKKRRWRR